MGANDMLKLPVWQYHFPVLLANYVQFFRLSFILCNACVVSKFIFLSVVAVASPVNVIQRVNRAPWGPIVMRSTVDPIVSIMIMYSAKSQLFHRGLHGARIRLHVCRDSCGVLVLNPDFGKASHPP